MQLASNHRDVYSTSPEPAGKAPIFNQEPFWYMKAPTFRAVSSSTDTMGLQPHLLQKDMLGHSITSEEMAPPPKVTQLVPLNI